jgi:demethylmenaquinone methyltransferase/2-methoxy-6-polyprenyl-1,4-benzoquinol methylase
MCPNDDEVVQQQITYYRERAREYDEWFSRQGRYDRGPEHTERWWHEVAEVRAALERARPHGRILEIACGTGIWTERLAPHAAHVTAVDASPEALAINRARVGAANVEYQSVDLFDWRPDATYDFVFFGFWLTHVPPARFDTFWALVGQALAEGGNVFLVDNLVQPEVSVAPSLTRGPATVIRTLKDGRQFRIVKIFYEPAELRERLHGLGWQSDLHATATFFLYGTAKVNG